MGRTGRRDGEYQLKRNPQSNQRKRRAQVIRRILTHRKYLLRTIGRDQYDRQAQRCLCQTFKSKSPPVHPTRVITIDDQNCSVVCSLPQCTDGIAKFRHHLHLGTKPGETTRHNPTSGNGRDQQRRHRPYPRSGIVQSSRGDHVHRAAPFFAKPDASRNFS